MLQLRTSLCRLASGLRSAEILIGGRRHMWICCETLTQSLYLTKTPRLYSTDLKIYTRTGDKGVTSLFTGERMSKDREFFNALGTTDELSSNIGLAKEFAAEKRHDYVDQLERIQCILQDISSLLATPRNQQQSNDPSREARIRERLSFNPRHITELEDWIDQYSSSLPDLTNFILPGGGRVSASLHVARTVCRRAERSIVPLATGGFVDEQVLIYINRLSDYLFTIARYASVLDGNKETIYIRPQSRKAHNLERKLTESQEVVHHDK
ncbi:corrinoid adenosyltransferase-like [Penaeus japonicus]|uniref:corrinoid adenosyltransferase-like n=1 Tax=Penaeus japonicus TaxID=27405 RepID=UPI001C713768|nr:corrinoid adenosyltransferase-like [Penaeus japonicus]XP_042879718.1 corrinoid adenosyltransferase-like [Penaeus japonicus]